MDTQNNTPTPPVTTAPDVMQPDAPTTASPDAMQPDDAQATLASIRHAKQRQGFVAQNPSSTINSSGGPVEGDTGLTGLTMGVGKGVASTIQGGTKLINKALPSGAQIPIINEHDDLKPHGIWEQIGDTGENVGEFFLGDEALKGLAQATKMVALARKYPAIGKVLQIAKDHPVLSKIITGGGIGGVQGGVKGAAEGNAAGGAEGGAVGGALGTAAGEGITKTIQSLTEELGPRIANTILKPLGKSFDFGKNPGQAVADEGIVASSAKDLHEKLSAKTDEIGAAIDRQITNHMSLQHPQVVIDALPLINQPIDDAINQTMASRSLGASDKQALMDRMEELRESMLYEHDISLPKYDAQGNLIDPGGKVVRGKPQPTDLTPLETEQLKRQVGKRTSWSGKPFEEDVNKVRRNIYGNLNNATETEVPGLEPLHDRYANALSATKSMERRLPQLQRVPILGTEGLIGAGGGALAGAMAGGMHGGVEGALIGGGLVAAKKR